MPMRNAPKIVRGAFIEYGLSLPPLFVVFQFNPLELARNRTLSFAPPNDAPACAGESEALERRSATRAQREPRTLREFHRQQEDLDEIQKRQKVTVEEETLSFDIRLDATDKLEEGDAIAGAFGILPQLSTLELMVHPKEESLIGAALGALLGSPGGFSFTDRKNPPLVLFISGIKRVLPVNINSMNIRETEFSTMLDPIRATVSVNLTVIEGKNPFFTYSKIAKEVSSVLNLANIADVANVVVPG
jgi:hypothetical protein